MIAAANFALPPLEPTRLPGTRVLLYAAEPVVEKVIEEMLLEAGCDCRTANSYESTLEAFRRDRTIGVLVVDCVQPDLEMQWFLNQVKDLRPEVVIVGSSDSEQTELLSQAGCQIALPKFWDLKELARALQQTGRHANYEEVGG